MNINDYVLVCEACVENGKLGTRRKVQGLITKGRKRTITSTEENRIIFFMFDCLTMEEWENKKCETSYTQRRNTVKVICKGSSIFKPGLYYIVEGNDTITMKKIVAGELNLGYEGIVIKPADHLYEWKRSWNWMRYKEAKTADLRVVDYVEGTGKYSGKMGALVCTGNVEGKSVLVQVGQGFSDLERQLDYVEAHFLDNIAEVTYNEVSHNNSLTIPIFIGIRHDKEDSDNA